MALVVSFWHNFIGVHFLVLASPFNTDVLGDFTLSPVVSNSVAISVLRVAFHVTALKVSVTFLVFSGGGGVDFGIFPGDGP